MATNAAALMILRIPISPLDAPSQLGSLPLERVGHCGLHNTPSYAGRYAETANRTD